MIEKFFNTAGPQKAELNYTIDPLSRLDWAELRYLIDSQRYFLLHAPRQTGKTTAMAAIVEALNNEGRYTALYVNIESAQTARNNVSEGIDTVCRWLASQAQLFLGDAYLNQWLNEEARLIRPMKNSRPYCKHGPISIPNQSSYYWMKSMP